MSEVTITIEIRDRFDKAFGDLADAINADVRNGAMRVVVRALEKAFCAIDEIAPHSLRAKALALGLHAGGPSELRLQER